VLFQKAKMKLKLLILVVVGILPTYLCAGEQWQIASKSEAINFGQKMTISIVKLEESIDWPVTFKMKLSGNGSSEEMALTVADSSTSKLNRVYVGVASKKYIGVVRAELVGLDSNRLILLASSDDAGAMQVAESQTATSEGFNDDSAEKSNAAMVVIAKPEDEPALSANEPMYFLVGNNSENVY
jgi:phospholipase A1